ncbi:P-loop containing nucleoside triphosphate hydrolase protein [Amylocystis lapponica]|nr:P-loop containing nucleoside triphosphate hydrolase protein [Amylocystis lapponica]
MSSDEYFDDEPDSAFLNAVDAIEAAHNLPAKASTSYAKPPSNHHPPPRTVIELSDDDEFDTFDIDEADLQRIDEICENELKRPPPPARSIAGPSKGSFDRTASKGAQTTLFGDIVQPTAPANKTNVSGKKPMERVQSTSKNPFGGRARKTKQWDQTTFAKTGWKKPKSIGDKGKGKGKASFNDDASGEEEEVEFEQFPAPFPPPMKLVPDLLAARRWIYPLNQPKRDYQFNIVKHSLFENTLVALPTGLGKTFIAGVVMLNFYNWFPEGKVIFVAPTKPLVAQQIDACHKTCGIPGSHAAELHGDVVRTKRAKAYDEKRVFYMTPQTLMNDLVSETLDPKDIVLLVVDEAHKATGDYDYARVVRFLMAKNPHFRLLALTATPGGNPEAVQAIVDSLHISHIEIRDEQSMDLRQYLFKKHLEQHIIPMNDDAAKLRDLLSHIMQPMITKCQRAGALRGSPDPIMLHPFRCSESARELHARKADYWLVSLAHKLGPLARAMSYLMEGSIGMCYTYLSGIATDTAEHGGKKSTGAIQKDPGFQALMKEIEAQKSRGFALHPKMEKLRSLLVHEADDSRVMVFVSFRECVDEVVEMLNRENPLIRATRFIGQGTDKHGRKGIAQKEQLEVIKNFKAGKHNVLVSTSIGEEGLDIGEIDMIVCYDAQKTPIRMLQRVGRTGRKRDGYVHVLLAEGREEKNWEKAQQLYKDVQHFIVRAEELELYGDVERLIPDHIKPECVEMMMTIEEHVREDPNSRKRSLNDDGNSSPKKRRKRDDNPLRNLPSGASTGFVNVKDLLVKAGAKTKKRKAGKDFDILAGEDDEDDLEIEAGLYGPRRTASTSAASKPASKAKKPKRAHTIADPGGKKKPPKASKKKTKPHKEPTGSEFEQLGAEDSDDAEIEKGLSLSHQPLSSRGRAVPRTPSPCVRPQSPLSQRSSSPAVPLADRSVIDLTTPDPSHPRVLELDSSPDRPLKFSHPRSVSPGEEIPAFAERSSEPPADSPLAPSRSISACDPAAPGDDDMAWLIEDDEDDLDLQVVASSPPPQREASLPVAGTSSEVEFVNDSYISHSPPPRKSTVPSPSSPLSRYASTSAADGMPPPALPVRPDVPPSPVSDDLPPEPSFAIRAPRRLTKKRTIAETRDSSPLAMPPPSQRRLQHPRSSPSPEPQPKPPKRKKRKFKDLAEAQKMNPWIDVEATHSGDERSLGSSDVDQPSHGYDRHFVQDFPETQVSPSYDQSAIYRRSLLTQAPGMAPVFADRPVSRGVGSFMLAGPSRPRPIVSSSPRLVDEDDGYVFGSFVVEDDAEISFAGNSSSEP